MTMMLDAAASPPAAGGPEAAPRTLVVTRLDPAAMAQLGDFVGRLGPEDIRLRFAAPRRLDSDAAIAAAFACGAGESEMIWAFAADGAIAGIASLALAGAARLELALVVRPDLRHRGVGLCLLAAAQRRARQRQVATLAGFIAWDNRPMAALALKAGFRATGAAGMLTEYQWPPRRDGG